MTNIALVVLDTLRKDAFDSHFDWLPGKRFERAYSTANWTVPAHASLFTGLYASEVGTHAKSMHFDTARQSLAERLQAIGYVTRGFSANTNVTGHFEFDRGFDEFHCPEERGNLTDPEVFDWRAYKQTTDARGTRKYLDALVACVKSDTRTIPSLVHGAQAFYQDDGVEYGGARELRSTLPDLDFGDREFFFCNLMETHEPFEVPDAYQRVEEPPLTESVGDVDVGAVDPEHVEAAYEDCATYLSDVYRDVFEQLRADFDYVITLSDHGELLGERDALGHEHGVHPELTHVPLVVSGEGMDGTCEKPVSLLDVHETVLALAGESSDTRGRSLLGSVESRDVLTEYHGLTGWSEEKLVDNGHADLVPEYERTLRGFASDEFYGYQQVDGFEEIGSGGPQDPSERLATLVDDLAVRAVAEDRDVPDEVADRLSDLGYA